MMMLFKDIYFGILKCWEMVIYDFVLRLIFFIVVLLLIVFVTS